MYQVRCLQCGALYDAVAAPQCDCLEPMRSVRCPSCQACFCGADEKFKTAFWENAPAQMRDRRSELSEPIDPAKVVHPLVVFADDDPTSRAIVRRIVQGLGHRLMVLHNGGELLDVARRYRPELVITDALMPRMDGREAARIIKTELPDTKVIVITSVYKGQRYKHEAITQFRADDYLQKPVTPAQLREAIVKLIASA